MINIEEMIKLREAGATYEELGEHWGVSREWARQVLLQAQADGWAVRDPYRPSPQQKREERRLARAEEKRKRREEYRATYLGRRFGAFVVTDVLVEIHEAIARCDCGTVSQVKLSNLRNGYSRSCGSKLHHIRGWRRASAPMNVIEIGEATP